MMMEREMPGTGMDGRRDGENVLTREQSKALAAAVLDALGVEEAQIDEEEREVIRRAVEEWRRRKRTKDGEGNG